MQPTNELRFIERRVIQNTGAVFGNGAPITETRVVRTLQQKWRHKDYPIVVDTEWRDVPCVKEET